MKKIFIAIFVFLLLILGIFFFSPTFFKIVYYNFPGIDDYKIFPHRQLKASKTPFHFKEDLNPARVPNSIRYGDEHTALLKEFLNTADTLAFLIVKDDTLIYEEYFKGHSHSSISMSFSVTKSFLSALVGIAVEEGYIQSLDQPVTDYVPELVTHGFAKVTFKNLLQMTSGMGDDDFGVFSNPFGKQARLTYTSNIEKELVDLELEEDPSKCFVYKSVDNALLGLILKRALNSKTMTEYMQEKVWTPLGMEYDARWSIDHAPDGIEKTWCCISAAARDLAKFGRLYLHRGNWDGKRIVPESWVEQSTKIDTTEGSAAYYQYGWWIMSKQYGDFRAEGILGQFVYVNPAKNIIIVRLGRSRGGLSWKEWNEVFTYLAENVY